MKFETLLIHLFKWRFLSVFIQKFCYHGNETWWQIQHKIHLKSGCILSFFFSADDKIIKRLWNIYTLHKFPFKNVIFLTIEQKNVPETWSLQKLRCLSWISKQDTLPFAVKKTSLNSGKDDFVTKNFLSPQKENWAFIWTFRFHLCLWTMYF